MKICLCPSGMESLFLPALRSSCTQAPLAFKAKCSGSSPPDTRYPTTTRLGNLMWGLKLSLLWENLCNIVIFQFVSCPPSRDGICVYHKSTLPTVLLWHFVFRHRIYFLRVSCLFFFFFFFLVNGCSWVSYDFGIFVRGGDLESFYSAIFSPSPQI